jgi:hypothetical protein
MALRRDGDDEAWARTLAARANSVVPDIPLDVPAVVRRGKRRRAVGKMGVAGIVAVSVIVTPPVLSELVTGSESAQVQSPAASHRLSQAPKQPRTRDAAPEMPPVVTLPAIVSAAQVDPPPGGDNNEHPESVLLAVDGNPETFWFTRTYNSNDYGGLKPGVGYAVTLAQASTVSVVHLQVRGTGGNVQVRASEPSSPAEGPVLAEGPLGPTTVLHLSQPVVTEHLVLWFTTLPTASDGANRLELAEVFLS